MAPDSRRKSPSLADVSLNLAHGAFWDVYQAT